LEPKIKERISRYIVVVVFIEQEEIKLASGSTKSRLSSANYKND
jgi:hypothetical protein